MIVGVLRLELQLYSPQSLKEKRSIVRRILGRCRERFPVSAAETGLHDPWQRAEVGFTAVGSDDVTFDALFEKIESEIERTGLAEICARSSDIFHY
ncbi:MAG: DUF503 domain-containing protein [Desulfuromonas sp.]|nr:MAG: DUF503 domain-containing protein [Desulfuromonas sp.]